MEYLNKVGLIASVSILFSSALQAAESGFLSSYKGLEFAEGEYGGKTVVAPKSVVDPADYTKIMIDQPEIFIAENSAYKGIKPEDALALSEALRKAITDNMTVLKVVDEPGPDVLYLRLAVSDLHLKKKKRHVLSYTPPGMVFTAAKGMVTTDIMKKLDLVGVTIEGETLDTESSEQVGSLLIKLAPPKAQSTDKASWEALMHRFDSMGKQYDCRFRNVRVPESERTDCQILESFREQ